MAEATIGYCTVNDLLLYGYQSKQDDSQFFQTLIPRVSAFIDSWLGVNPGFFYTNADLTLVGGTTGSTAREFVGDGRNWLRVDPFTAVASVAAPSGYDTPTYRLVRPDSAGNSYSRSGSRMGFFLERTYDEGRTIIPTRTADKGWRKGLIFTVTATWGWSAIPADITEACAETCCAIWRTRDVAFMKNINLQTNTVISAEALPPRAKEILARYKNSSNMINFA